MSSEQDKKQKTHQKKMEALKESIDASVAAADIDRGVGILLTGNGKGKSSSAFGMVMRSLGYDYKVGVVQFIKGQQLSGEEIYVREKCPSVTFHQMNTGLPGTLRIAHQILQQPKQAGLLLKKCYRMRAIIWLYWMS